MKKTKAIAQANNTVVNPCTAQHFGNNITLSGQHISGDNGKVHSNKY